MPGIAIQGINNDASGKGLPLKVLNASFSELSLAGSEAIAVVLTGAINHLVHGPPKFALLAAEIRNCCHTAEEIMPHLNAVLNEALRLCGPV